MIFFSLSRSCASWSSLSSSSSSPSFSFVEIFFFTQLRYCEDIFSFFFWATAIEMNFESAQNLILSTTVVCPINNKIVIWNYRIVSFGEWISFFRWSIWSKSQSRADEKRRRTKKKVRREKIPVARFDLHTHTQSVRRWFFQFFGPRSVRSVCGSFHSLNTFVGRLLCEFRLLSARANAHVCV